MQDSYVILKVSEAVDVHTPQDPPSDGGHLVIGKIHLAVAFEHAEDFFQKTIFAVEGIVVGLAITRAPLNANQFLRDARRRQNIVGHPGFHGAVRHAIVLGGFEVLHKGDAAGILNGGEAQSPIAGRSRQDDTDGVAGLVVGQRAEEGVNRQMVSSSRLAPGEMQHALDYRHVAIGWQNVDRVDLHPHAIRGLPYRQRCGSGQKFNHRAFMRGIKVRNEDKRDAGIGRQSAEQVAESFQAARRGAYGSDRERNPRRGILLLRLFRF